MKTGSLSNLRGGADIALLLSHDLNSCGRAFLNTIGNGLTVGVVKRSCATGYYSFGHEIAHMYGAYHNREVENRATGFGYGYLIKRDNGTPSGYRTIMS